MSSAKKFELARAARGQFERLSQAANSVGLTVPPEVRILGMDDGPAPWFSVRAANGTEFRSDSLVGHGPFVVLFFATWCNYCTSELRTLRRALDAAGPVRIVPVAVDGPETWHDVTPFWRSFGFDEPVIRASDHPMFALAYDPFDVVPLVVIVGNEGELVDYELGYEPADEKRLTAALHIAKAGERLGKRPAAQAQAR